MDTSKSPREVGEAMERYDIRVGRNPLPRETDPLGLNPIHCFDKGHHRVLSRNKLLAAVGNYIRIRNRDIELAPNVGVIGVRLPRGFVAVPEQVILQHFTTRYGRNILKIERALVQHQRDFTMYLRELRIGNDLGRPRRPSWNSLNLDNPTEFERFLHPLKSFYFQRLRMAFTGLVRDAEDGQQTVFANLNILALPDNGNQNDQAALARWQAAEGRYIAVRLDNFNVFINVPPPQFPAPAPPFPAPVGPLVPPVGGAAPPLAPAPAAPVILTPIQQDERMLELCEMGRSTRWKRLFLYMTPWQMPIKVSNPFVSPEYRSAFIVAQEGFYNRYINFKNIMEAKRAAHALQWRQYRAYRDEMRSVSMLDNNRQPVNRDFAGVERPQVEHFTREWKHFTFGLKEEMKIFKFLPINIGAPVALPAAVPPFVGGPVLQPYADISKTVLNSARRMFLI